jgi:uncharacterized protein (TIGR00288 family)
MTPTLRISIPVPRLAGRVSGRLALSGAWCTAAKNSRAGGFGFASTLAQYSAQDCFFVAPGLRLARVNLRFQPPPLVCMVCRSLVHPVATESAMETEARRVAVLIDADNASAAHAAGIFEEVAKHGEANVRRIYGDFSGTRLRSWRAQMQPLAIVPQQTFNYTTGKNAADISLVIDAMDLMHTGAVDLFCLVSSDSDFTRLAQRLRESGKTVIGFGERKTPPAFRNACNRFIYLDNLEPAVTDQPQFDGDKATIDAPPESAPIPAGGSATETQDAEKPKKEPPSKAAPLILKAMAGHEDEEGWAGLGGIGTRLQSIAPDFDPRNYGFGKLSDVVRKAGAFDIEKAEGRQLRVRQRRPRQRGA